MLINLRSPALIGAILVIPFMILELVNRRKFDEGFPFLLFGILWLMPVAFLLILMPLVRDLRAGNRILVNPINQLLRVVVLILIVWLWAGALIDQMPCFLGVPNCD
ncbi:MAG: hypothetical protein H6Q38_1361 [Chloroflexi bacterium]|nr:hypothetical protein [Chloroflexota bacterium]